MQRRSEPGHAIEAESRFIALIKELDSWMSQCLQSFVLDKKEFIAAP